MTIRPNLQRATCKLQFSNLTMARLFFKNAGTTRRASLAGCRLLVAGCMVVSVSACRQDMHDAPRYDPYEQSAIFPNGSSAQPLVAGTVSRAETAGAVLDEDELLNAGKVNGQMGTEFPFAITRADLDRGEERFNIYCSPCHGKTGEGNGMVVQRGYRQAANFHIDRLRVMPIGYFVDVMANGFGAMPDYRMQLTPADRWRVAAFVRALQLSHAAAESDVPAAELERLKSGAPAPAAAAGAHGSQK